ncbi:hypothetical protein CBX96_19945 [Shewanella sp. BC20]|nr:hypothetical protein CBX96_19945 [Shewanella sp. BC20]
MTRRAYIPIGSTAASMPPTVTVTTMAILTNIKLFIWPRAYAPLASKFKKHKRRVKMWLQKN